MSNSLNIAAASHEGKLFIVQQTVQANPDAVNTKDEASCQSRTPINDERTPLHWAASGGHLDITEYLIRQKADVHATDDSGWTALLIASSAGHTAVVQFLIESGADVNAQNESGQTALHYAASKNRLDIGNLLIEKGADVNKLNNLKQAAIHRAAAQGYTAFVRMLIQQGKSKVNIRDSVSNTPLHLACEEGRGDTATLLIENGADPDRVNQSGQTPLDLCPTKQLRAFIEKAIEQ